MIPVLGQITVHTVINSDRCLCRFSSPFPDALDASSLWSSISGLVVQMRSFGFRSKIPRKMDRSQLPRCDKCGMFVSKGTNFYHCFDCPSEPGFDICRKCYGPRVHAEHRNSIEGGTYPEFDPYSEFQFFNSSVSVKNRNLSSVSNILWC